jgi:hypothetical protein
LERLPTLAYVPPSRQRVGQWSEEHEAEVHDGRVRLALATSREPTVKAACYVVGSYGRNWVMAA